MINDLSAVIVTDLLFILLNRYDVLRSECLKKWYTKYELSAIIADVAIIFFVMTFTRAYVAPGKTGLSLLLVILAVQVVHDVMFYFIFKSIPRGKSETMDFFKAYADEIGVKAIIGDSMMMGSAFVLSLFFSKYMTSTVARVLMLTAAIYAAPYVLYG